MELSEKCHHCGSEQPPDFKFCNKCGQRNLKIQRRITEKEEEFQKNLKYLIAYTFIIIGALLVNYYLDESFEVIIAITVVFAVIDIVFSAIQPEVFNLFRTSLKLSRVIIVMLIFISTGIVVSFSVGYLNETLFNEYYDYSYSFLDTDHPLIYSLIFTAVFPAIFEELAFRGFIFNNIEKVSGTKSAIWGSSFLFALVHFSLVSLFWLIPFALILTWLRRKYSTIVYGMIGHFCHNATVVFIDYFYG